MFGKKNETEQRDILIAYKSTFSSPHGKQVLFDLLSRYHVLNEHDGDPLKEGQRSVVLHILRQLHVNLEEFDKMLKGEFE